jgi:hypothetical protein
MQSPNSKTSFYMHASHVLSSPSSLSLFPSLKALYELFLFLSSIFDSRFKWTSQETSTFIPSIDASSASAPPKQPPPPSPASVVPAVSVESTPLDEYKFLSLLLYSLCFFFFFFFFSLSLSLLIYYMSTIFCATLLLLLLVIIIN